MCILPCAYFKPSHLKQSNKPQCSTSYLQQTTTIPSVKLWQFQYIEILLTCICITHKPRYNCNEMHRKGKEILLRKVDSTYLHHRQF
ncbi:hypothetical protein EUGRSUZ_F01465 [Eucalyptus grandis]|uniref:Uncharacterized protein n=2 Tax=Eucalyptus grandis TaxID=71139 RepID=A0ACC3KED7_EUCGR|nr:hypothetical protein EUGRSUZ_F01465 [Eucalyptus grandis]